jgi:hypothetical protein
MKDNVHMVKNVGSRKKKIPKWNEKNISLWKSFVSITYVLYQKGETVIGRVQYTLHLEKIFKKVFNQSQNIWANFMMTNLRVFLHIYENGQ